MKLMMIAFLLAGVTVPGDAGKRHPAAEIAAAEIAFAHDSVTGGLNTAFASHFAEEAVDFAPRPRERARRFYVDEPNPPVVLDWYPAFTLAAASGDFGLSTGPFVISDPEGKRPDVHGHYVSVWQKQPDGEWKVLIDGGVSHPAPDHLVPPLDPATMAANQQPAQPEWQGTGEHVLLQQDALLSSLAAEQGVRQALDALGAERMRFYREGRLPVIGRDVLLAKLPDIALASHWEPQGAGIAASGDLGFTYGISTRRSAGNETRGAYLHVWQRQQDGWRLLLLRDVALPAKAG